MLRASACGAQQLVRVGERLPRAGGGDDGGGGRDGAEPRDRRREGPARDDSVPRHRSALRGPRLLREAGRELRGRVCGAAAGRDVGVHVRGVRVRGGGALRAVLHVQLDDHGGGDGVPVPQGGGHAGGGAHGAGRDGREQGQKGGLRGELREDADVLAGAVHGPDELLLRGAVERERVQRGGVGGHDGVRRERDVLRDDVQHGGRAAAAAAGAVLPLRQLPCADVPGHHLHGVGAVRSDG